MISITPSKLSEYLSCPLKYKLRHVERKGGYFRSPQLAFGTAMHRALQDMYMADDERDVPGVLDTHWNVGDYYDAEQSDKYFAKGTQALEKYHSAFLNPPPLGPLGTEVYLTFIVQQGEIKVRLGAKADRIDMGHNFVEVIDYKTNAHGKTPTEESLKTDLPTFLYYLLARKRYPGFKDVKFTYLNVLTLARSSVIYTEEEVVFNKRVLWEAIKGIARSEFSPTPSEACSWCNHKDECPAANRTVDLRIYYRHLRIGSP